MLTSCFTSKHGMCRADALRWHRVQSKKSTLNRGPAANEHRAYFRIAASSAQEAALAAQEAQGRGSGNSMADKAAAISLMLAIYLRMTA